MNHKSAKYFLLYSLATIILLIAITEPSLKGFHKGLFNQFERSLLEPLFYWSIAISVSSLILLFFSKEVFTHWYRKVFLWVVPIGFVITFLTNPGISYGGLSRLSTATLFGEVLVIATFIFALLQRFYYKR